MKDVTPKSIYIHLPFCATKCPYCDFASYEGHGDDKFWDYTIALVNEIDFRLTWFTRGKDRPIIETIFFGGGTPSLHDKAQLEAIITTIKKYCDLSENVEITLEANPGTINRGKLKSFKNIGINRISIGAQTFDYDLLIKLGRGHSLADTFQALEDIASLDFNSWSFDLIYGLPKQRPESWQETVDIALSYKPPHISAYALSIEKNTPYGKIYKDSSHPDLPLEDNLVEMYDYAHQKFEQAGLARYEISNWARPGHEARHNLTYWHAEEYFAFGLSAHGYVDNYRYFNNRDLEKYLSDFKDPVREGAWYEFTEAHSLINANEQLIEKIMLALRLSTGLELNSEIKKHINLSCLEGFIEDGFVYYLDEPGEARIALSNKGLMLSNRIIAELLSQSTAISV